MSKQGYIKVHRQLQECWLYDEKPFCFMGAWIDLLLRAGHKDTKIYIDGVLEDIPRGTFVSSIAKLSESWGWDRKKTTKFLDTLEKDNMISRKSTTHRTTITIVNYGVFQDFGATEGQPITQPITQPLPQPKDNGGITEGQPFPTNNNVKNVKECINNDKEIKHIYGEYKKVRLSDKEFEKLCADYGEEKTLKAIEYLDEYMKRKGYTAKDHNLTLRKWVFDAVEEEARKKNKANIPNNNQYANDKQAQKLNIIFNGGLTE